MIRNLFGRATLALAAIGLAFSPASAANLAVKDGAGSSQTVCTVAQGDSSQAYCFTYRNLAGAQEDLATKAGQATNTAAITGTQTAPGTAATTASAVQGVPGGVPQAADTVVRGASTDIGATVIASTSATLAAANTSRRGFAIQNQTTGACYMSGLATATADYHSLQIAAGSYYESKDSHVGTGALSIICAANGGVYARQW